MFFEVLVVLFLIFGLLWKAGFKLFLVVIAVIPFSNSFGEYFYKYGLYAYDFYFFGLFFSFVLRLLVGRSKLYSNMYFMVPFFVMFVYSLRALYSNGWGDIYYLRDFRPLLFVFEAALLWGVIRRWVFTVNDVRHIIFYFIFSAIFNMFWQLASFLGYINFNDAFYQVSSHRYFDLKTYSSCIFIILFVYCYRGPLVGQYLFSKFNTILKVALLVSLVSVFASGFRMIAVALSLAVVALSIHEVKGLLLLLKLMVVGVLVLFCASYFVDADRLNSLISYEAIIYQLDIRYGPAFDRIHDMSALELFFGAGFGSTFTIEWYEYRELDTVNNVIDSSYFTFYVKYGVFGFLILLAIARAAGNFMYGSMRRGVMVFIMLLYVVYAVPYQAAGVGIFLGVTLCGLIYKHADAVLSGKVIA